MFLRFIVTLLGVYTLHLIFYCFYSYVVATSGTRMSFGMNKVFIFSYLMTVLYCTPGLGAPLRNVTISTIWSFYQMLLSKATYSEFRYIQWVVKEQVGHQFGHLSSRTPMGLDCGHSKH